ncbi:MAG: hypothetical protein KKB50_19675 [Planctomycetes bacterium]|nr:hypothetical protein [Planctomycetota bacterium]
MPDESKTVGSVSGVQTVAGTIASKVEHIQPRSDGFFSGKQPDVWMFRIQDETSGRTVQCRFEGNVQGMIDQGDRVTAQGYISRGVLTVRRLTDENGAVLAQASCFVATVAFGDVLAPEVETLRRFRERVLCRTVAGRVMIAWYWRVGPRLAGFIEHRPRLRTAVRDGLLGPVCWIAARAMSGQPAQTRGER